jgi:glycine betaine/proline transport system ATP-binding protein
MNPKISVRNACKIFGNTPELARAMLARGDDKAAIFAATGQTVGVENATFDVAPGEIFVVMGLSGSGKSTLVRMLNGLIAPTAGEILIDGVDVASCGPALLRQVRREKVAMVFQHFALLPHKTVGDNVGFGLKLRGVGKDERHRIAARCLDQVGLGGHMDSYPAQLSGGMQQRVGLARALANDPDILLMDEPFGALDPLIRREMQDQLVALQKTLNKTIVFITHDLNEALFLGDRIAIMKDGRFVQTGTAQDIVDNPADDYVSAFVADIDRGRVFNAGDAAQPAVTVDLGSDTVDSALARMEDVDSTTAYVMQDGELAGIVTHQQLSVANRAPDAQLEDEMIRDFPVADGGTPLHALYGAASGGLPVAITDADNRLVGVVEPQALLGQLSSPDTGEGGPAAPEAPIAKLVNERPEASHA